VVGRPCSSKTATDAAVMELFYKLDVPAVSVNLGCMLVIGARCALHTRRH
jgi:hypothetical protein